MTSVTLQQLTRSFSDGMPAVDRVSLQVADQELLALVGPSGAGKTTILRMIAGLTKPTGGEILFDGKNVAAMPPEKRGAVMVFQSHGLFPFMSVGDNVAYGLRRKGVSKSEIVTRVRGILSAVSLPDFADRWPDQLSGGQQQRVALARALVIQPNILLLDEPLSNLDPELRESLRQTIQTIRHTHPVTTLFVTHDQTEATAIADRIGLLINGQLRQLGVPRDFYDRPKDEATARFFGGVNFFRGQVEGEGIKVEGIGQFPIQPTSPTPLLTIRPEAIQLGGELRGVVQECVDLGAKMRCCAIVNGTELYFDLSPQTAPQIGDTVYLHMPTEHVHQLEEAI